MIMISGTVKNAVQLQALDNKWQQKKESGIDSEGTARLQEENAEPPKTVSRTSEILQKLNILTETDLYKSPDRKC